MKLTDKQEKILNTDGHLLVTGGPGSGKTTISILKAAQLAKYNLHTEQKILFLSFARATVSRVVEAIEHEQKIPREQKRRIDVDTYHSFFWRILKTHGYLIGLKRRLSILAPPNEAIALSAIRSEYPANYKLSETDKNEKWQREDKERLRLANEDGHICFSLFANFTSKILDGCRRIRQLIATKYPVIILDEFQDTSEDQWKNVLSLGQHCKMLAVADPEQRIYDWIGADPKRLEHFRDAFKPSEFDLCSDNHRSGGTEIAIFGNDILKGKFKKGRYQGINRSLYEPNQNQAWTALVITVLKARKRLIETGRKKWSLAVLVPTKKMVRLVSDALRSPPSNIPEIRHTVVVEMEAAILGAEIIAYLMQPDNDGSHFKKFIDLFCNYFKGKGGDAPAKKDLQEAQRLRSSYGEYLERQASGKNLRKNSVLCAIINVYNKVCGISFTGNPYEDWLTIRRTLEKGPCSRLKGLAKEVRNVRLLQRGTQLRNALSQDWRESDAYMNALAITRQAFIMEHFSTTHKPETGVIVMNMHKAKGKQFDEVIIFEGWPRYARNQIVANPDRIVWSNSRENDNEQARYNFRVSVTRGKAQTSILTPKGNPCILLINQN